MKDTLLPPAKIGILGGGQLGRMMALEARAMGYRLATLDPTEDCPCGQVVDEQVIAAFDDLEGAKQLASISDVVTYEFENISSEIADHLEQYSDLPQGYTLLYTTQNRLREKRAIERAGGEVAAYHRVLTVDQLNEGLDHLGYPAVLKTAEGGYDGKGQYVIRAEGDLTEVEQALQAGQATHTEWVLEQWVPFQQEISCIVARNSNGTMSTFPIAENIHKDNILHVSIAPARVSKHVQEKAARLALQLAESFDMVGLLAIEMFVLSDGRLLVNELAPRPHNSGHYTQQACVTNQFEQHIRAICNLPLGNTKLIQPTVMVNVLGEHLQPLMQKMSTLDQDMKVHLYGKKEAKFKRKMGHINVISDSIEESINKIKALNIWDMEGIT